MLFFIFLLYYYYLFIFIIILIFLIDVGPLYLVFIEGPMKNWLFYNQ